LPDELAFSDENITMQDASSSVM